LGGVHTGGAAGHAKSRQGRGARPALGQAPGGGGGATRVQVAALRRRRFPGSQVPLRRAVLPNRSASASEGHPPERLEPKVKTARDTSARTQRVDVDGWMDGGIGPMDGWREGWDGMGKRRWSDRQWAKVSRKMLIVKSLVLSVDSATHMRVTTPGEGQYLPAYLPYVPYLPPGNLQTRTYLGAHSFVRPQLDSSLACLQRGAPSPIAAIARHQCGKRGTNRQGTPTLCCSILMQCAYAPTSRLVLDG